MARLVGTAAHLGQKRLPFVTRLAVIVPVGAGVLAAMVEEADIVVLALERPDLTLDEGVEFAEMRRDLRGNVEIHGPFLRANALIDGLSPAILGATPVDAEAAVNALCRPADCCAARRPTSVSVVLWQVVRDVEPRCLAADKDVTHRFHARVRIQRAQGKPQHIRLCVELGEQARPALRTEPFPLTPGRLVELDELFSRPRSPVLRLPP